MTNHNDQDARKAREWAEYITSVRELHGDYTLPARAAARFILANTDSPLPDPLFGARATHPAFGEGVVISHHPNVDGDVGFMFPDEATADGTNYQWVEPSTLTVHAPDHPVFLETEEDYRSAGVGTIVAEDCTASYTQTIQGWLHPHKNPRDHKEMSGTRRRVLRWGWEA